MPTDIFGDELLDSFTFKIVYKGASFDEGSIRLSTLYTELQSVEGLIKDSLRVLVTSGKLDPEYRDVDICIQIERGSISETFKVIFTKKNAAKVVITAAVLAGDLVVDLINTTYSHFLGEKSSEDKFAQEIALIEDDERYKNNLNNVLAPIQAEQDSLVINNNTGTINVTINYSDKNQILENLRDPKAEDDFGKTGEFREELTGVIRKLDLDATHNSYFGFTVDNGPSRIPTSISGEFNLNDYKELIDQHIKISALVKYKNDEIKHIQIEKYILLTSQDNLDL